MKLVELKSEEIRRRGLNGYPVTGDEDLLRIEGVAALLRTLADVACLRIPGREILVPWDSALPPELAYYLAVDDYEHHDLDLIREYVRPGDTAMELGGGIGITGVALAQASGAPVVVVEPDPALHARIARTFEANGATLQLIPAAASDRSGEAAFHVSDNFWWSSIEGYSLSEAITVRRIALDDLLTRYLPSVLAIDIEGHERTLTGTVLPDCLRLVLIEIHTPDIGTAATGHIVSWLFGQRFVLRDVRANSWVFERIA